MVMDNAAIHHVEEVVTLIEDVGAIPIFLPPYSPDIMNVILKLNPTFVQVTHSFRF